MPRIQQLLATIVLGALVGCATGVGGSPRVADPRCSAYRVDVDPAIEPGRPIERPQPGPPKFGPPVGYVCVQATITKEGRVADPEVRATNDDAFAAAFVAALSRWRYEPATRDGEAVSFRTLLSASYRR